jgi:hypothetical protein
VERRQAPVQPSDSSTQLRKLVGVEPSMLLMVRLTAAGARAATCLRRVFCSRVMLLSSTLTCLAAVVESSPVKSWALAMAAWREMVATCLPASTSSARKLASAWLEARSESN